MDDLSWIRIGLSVPPLLLHSLAFCLLISTGYRLKFNQIQRFYLLNLSFTEAAFCLLAILCESLKTFVTKNVVVFLRCINDGGMVCLLYLIYFLLTIDRFLMAFLGLRYSQVIVFHHVRWIFIACYVISIAMTLILLLVHQGEKILMKIITLYVYVPLNALFIVLACITYVYIAIANTKRQRSLAATSITTPAATNLSKNQTHLSMVPFLLIASFIVFYAIPDFIFAYYTARDEQVVVAQILLYSCYAGGSLTDAVLYIFMLRTIRKKINIPSIKHYAEGHFHIPWLHHHHGNHFGMPWLHHETRPNAEFLPSSHADNSTDL